MISSKSAGPHLLMTIFLSPCFLLISVSLHAQSTWLRLSGGTVTETGKYYESKISDTSGVLVTGKSNYTLSHSSVFKTGNSTRIDSSSRSGQNAGVLVEKNSIAVFDHDTIVTDGAGANGLFITGSATSTSVSNSIITASGVHAHGVDVTYLGTLSLSSVYVSSTGDTAPALATDCAGGYINFDRGTIIASGRQSSGIYSTGTITVANAGITAYNDHGAVIDVDGIINLTASSVVAAQSGLMIHNTVGSSKVATAVFAQCDITANGGHVVYDTAARLTLTFNGGNRTRSSSGNLIYGVKGAVVNAFVNTDSLSGNVMADASSVINITLSGKSLMESSFQNASLTLNPGSEVSLTADSHLKAFKDSASVDAVLLSVSNVTGNGFNLYYNAALAENKWLSGLSYGLKNGGCLLPEGATCSSVLSLTAVNRSKVNLYPNPAGNFIQVQYAIAGSNYEISGADGRVLASGTISSGRLDVQQLPSGFYVLTLVSSGEKMYFKFCKE
ncbi:T9SS type A sorting domain-containing protein [Rurimicrobium arvi]